MAWVKFSIRMRTVLSNLCTFFARCWKCHACEHSKDADTDLIAKLPNNMNLHLSHSLSLMQITTAEFNENVSSRYMWTAPCEQAFSLSLFLSLSLSLSHSVQLFNSRRYWRDCEVEVVLYCSHILQIHNIETDICEPGHSISNKCISEDTQECHN